MLGISKVYNHPLFLFQALLSAVVVLTNFYCVLTFMFMRKLRTLDFFLAFFQCSIDFLFTGVFSLISIGGFVRLYFTAACQFWSGDFLSQYSDKAQFDFNQFSVFERYVIEVALMSNFFPMNLASNANLTECAMCGKKWRAVKVGKKYNARSSKQPLIRTGFENTTQKSLAGLHL